ncbi:MAG: hypothetical protein ACFFD2_16455 [Promethearchaeota archaeon]
MALIILIAVGNNGRELLKIIRTNGTTEGTARSYASGDRGSPSVRGRIKEEEASCLQVMVVQRLKQRS